MQGSALLLGQAGATATPGALIWELADGADDGGSDYDVFAISNPLSPGNGTRVSVFRTAIVTLTWTMAVTLRFTPLVDEDEETIARIGGSVQTLPIEITLAAPTGGRVTRSFRIPLLRLILGPADEELSRNAVVGTRLRLQIESVGGLGLGDLIFDGVAIEHDESPDQKRSEG
jgi:hypothetical protein